MNLLLSSMAHELREQYVYVTSGENSTILYLIFSDNLTLKPLAMSKSVNVYCYAIEM